MKTSAKRFENEKFCAKKTSSETFGSIERVSPFLMTLDECREFQWNIEKQTRCSTRKIHFRDRLFIILTPVKKGKCNMFYRLFLSPDYVLGLNMT